MYRKCFKRLFDVVFSLVGLFVLLPILTLSCVIIKITSKGTIFYTQERLGKNGQTFRILKLRTMVKDADKSQRLGVEVSLGDARITPVGKILRRLKLDELIQLINILKGDMSFIGPRPTLKAYLDEYEEWELERLSVRPGLSGLAQIRGNIYLTRIQKSYYDIVYIKQMNFLTDIKIIVKTIGVVVFGEKRFIAVPPSQELLARSRNVQEEIMKEEYV